MGAASTRRLRSCRVCLADSATLSLYVTKMVDGRYYHRRRAPFGRYVPHRTAGFDVNPTFVAELIGLIRVLGEAGVARAFKSSRIPAAAALQRLGDEGLIKKFGGRGYLAVEPRRDGGPRAIRWPLCLLPAARRAQRLSELTSESGSGSRSW
jgi:hypothetical protein